MRIKLKLWFLSLLSLFSFKPVEIGYGLTTDDNANLKKLPSIEEMEIPLRKSKIIYELNDSSITGNFEFVDVVRKGNSVTYILKHTLTRTKVSIPKRIFDLMFVKKELD